MAGNQRDTCNVVVVPAKRAYERYLKCSVFNCQVGRPFRQGMDRLGFYANGAIQREFPRILAPPLDRVPLTQKKICDLRASGDAQSAAFADAVQCLIDNCWRETKDQQLFLLSGPSESKTLCIPHAIQRNQRDALGRRRAWARKQRYVPEAVLLAGPKTTSELDAWIANGIPGSVSGETRSAL